MLNFIVDEKTCINCGQCASDCPAMIISMDSGVPVITENLAKFCIACLHCVAICSEGSVSILGHGPTDGLELPGNRPSPEQVELLIKGRRTVRNYQDKNLPAELIDKLLEVTWHAPSGHNDREVLYTVVDDKAIVASLREGAFAGIEQIIAENLLPEGMEMFVDIIEAWKLRGKDILFRGAPHLLIASASEESASPLEDCLIGLTTFELYAQAHGVGTIWNGLATLTITELVPSLIERLNIPKDHKIGYAMGFGYPAIRYKRTVNRGAPRINRVR